MVRFMKPFLVLLMMMTMTGNHAVAEEISLYHLNVLLQPDTHTVEGHVTLTFPAGNEITIDTDSFTVTGWSLNGKTVSSLDGIRKKIRNQSGPHVLELDYRKEFSDTPGGNVVNSSAVMLLSGWYPEIHADSRYQLTVTLPPELTPVSETDSVLLTANHVEKTVYFDFPHPTPGITLVAGPYHVREEKFRDITLRTLFFAEDDNLSFTYLDQARDYIDLYEKILGKFPYPLFSIVENRYPTGYSFPTYTLIGSRVVKLPFIVKTSLGHEILHQWFGNSVYVKKEKGNWAEGLTTYLADHWYQEQQGQGAEYRKKLLIDYRNYVSQEKEIPLKDFRQRKDRADQAVGYGKAAMVFHMLRKEIGDTLFFAGLNKIVSREKFRTISWQDLEKDFSAVTRKDLAPFFRQWVERNGLLSFHIKGPNVVYRDGQYRLTLDIRQEGEPYRFTLPVTVVTPTGRETFRFPVDQSLSHLVHISAERPTEVILDEEYDLLRKLTVPETPPVLSAFTANTASLVILPEDDPKEYREAVDLLREKKFKIKSAKEITGKELRNHSLLIVTTQNRVYQRLFADAPLPQGDLVVSVKTNPLNPKFAAVILDGDKPETSLSILKKLFHYGNYSELIFQGEQVVMKKTLDTDRGIVINLGVKVEAVETRKNLDLNNIFEKIQDQRLIFVGESHTSYAHHVIQREIIRRLYKTRGKLIIGMEMFQRPYQKYLDRYIQGAIDEEEMLKQTEYFTRWKYEYNLYRDILQYARTKKIPVIALNLQAEIIQKVTRQGITALTEEEEAAIPRDIDMTNQAYREAMKEIFGLHPHADRHGGGEEEGASFENFFQSQILWDETMAHSIAETLENNPDTPMVVLAGNGHLQYSWGIPDRVQRITGIRGTVILNDITDTISRNLADYILFPEPMETPESPKLMVMLEEKEEGVEVVKLLPESPAQKAGMEKGDVITGIGGEKVGKIDDIKIALLGREKGDTIEVIIQRKRMLLGAKEVKLKVEL